MKVFIILTILFLCSVFALWEIHKNRTREATYLAIVSILLFTAIYCVSVLGYKIGGGYITLEEAQQVKKDIYAAKADVQEMAKLLIETAYIQMDGTGRWGGIPPEHKAEIQKNANLLLEKTFRNNDERQKFLEAIEGKIKDLNAQIKKRKGNK